MNKIFLATISLFVFAPTLWAAPIPVNLDCSEAKGPVVVLVFDSMEGFRGLKGPILERVVDCDTGFELEALDLEEFVVVVYFDQNKNGKLDRNFMGIPSEPIGFSGNYSPKGPPQYSKAVVKATALVREPIVLEMNEGLGPRGRFGVGALMLYRSSIYRGEDSSEFRFLPGLSYIGKRIQVLGPNVSVGLWSGERVRSAVSGSFLGGAYEEDDSPVLRGLGDREDTFVAGVSLNLEVTRKISLSMRLQGDVLDRVGGGLGEATLSYDVDFDKFSLRPYVGLSWQSRDMANHSYGVEVARAREDLASYELGSILNPELGLRVMKTWGENYMALLNVSLQRLDDAVYDSPIVDERYRVGGFVSLSYQF